MNDQIVEDVRRVEAIEVDTLKGIRVLAFDGAALSVVEGDEEFSLSIPVGEVDLTRYEPMCRIGPVSLHGMMVIMDPARRLNRTLHSRRNDVGATPNFEPDSGRRFLLQMAEMAREAAERDQAKSKAKRKAALDAREAAGEGKVIDLGDGEFAFQLTPKADETENTEDPKKEEASDDGAAE